MRHFTLIISVLLICGCIMEEQLDVKTKTYEADENTIQSDSYYWFNGKQEPLQKISEYSFVITDENTTDNLNNIITRSGISPQKMSYNRYVVNKKAFPTNNESRIVWSKIPTKILPENETDILYSAPYFRTAEGYQYRQI